MARLHPRVTVDAYDREVIELKERLGLVPFAKEEILAVVTPRLQVIRVIGILDEANNAISHFQLVPAHDRSHPFPVAIAIDHHRRITCHLVT